ncbi:hypothetical protein BO70DRAFT_231377 [Aspergillus heteromorphus CBS 117.55]|uniref:Uncharacterized protein n=1 Tax=Aspergillus heteromorphus CBS 117.55 TaxID=1448321 RepID=A0A317WEP6_9EURO|nr:uncharacterized protein BO70DRAFT_231377 [Aspergillus heteromorphus CBS 117.55]PWY84946.1 hypothetical protein BO70DRAFT_231377 [Aspergillus heteromorphus CBS 117.55]
MNSPSPVAVASLGSLTPPLASLRDNLIGEPRLPLHHFSLFLIAMDHVRIVPLFYRPRLNPSALAWVERGEEIGGQEATPPRVIRYIYSGWIYGVEIECLEKLERHVSNQSDAEDNALLGVQYLLGYRL